MPLHLNKLSYYSPSGPVLLMIMDGIGIGNSDASNAFYKAHTPHLDRLMKPGPFYTQLKAHGTAVGMPSDQDMGNSEVGHNTLGAGRVFEQGATLVKKAVQSKRLFHTPTWKKWVSNCKAHDSTFHLIGLLSDGNVHAHISHVLAMLTQLASQVSRVRLHVLLDGRDVYKRSALTYLAQLEDHLSHLNHTHGTDFQIASGGGRMITTMDRYNADWTIVERGWHTHVLGKGAAFSSAAAAVQDYYDRNSNGTDQTITPFVIHDTHQKPKGPILDGDSVVCFNFRGDRVIELSTAFEAGSDFTHFDRVRTPDVLYAGMMEYDGDLRIPRHYLVSPPSILHPISEYLCHQNIRSFAISETQKYGHVTYFWNGNNSGHINKSLETYIEIPSDTVPINEKPEMKAREITDKTIDLLRSGQYDFGRLNFPNGDMVGHTGDFAATVTACEVTDECVGRLIQTVKDLNGTSVILADHGNADQMFVEKNGEQQTVTCHTLNPVPFIVVPPTESVPYRVQSPVLTPGLANVAATLIELLGFEPPSDYEKSLLYRSL